MMDKNEFPKKVLITGGCGFIGTSLIQRLVNMELPPAIRVLDNLDVGTPEDLKAVSDFVETTPQDCVDVEGVAFIKGDITDQEVMSLCARGVDCIVHLAANTGVGPSVENPRLDMESNVGGIFNALEAARENGVNSFVFASSGAPAGAVEPPIHEELPPHPISPYGASKLAGEAYCSAYYHTFGIDTVCLRFGNVYGPRSKKKSSIVAKFIRQALAGEVCEIYGDGLQTRDFIYIEDLIDAMCLAMKGSVGGETFQIAAGTEMTILDLVEVVERALSRRNIPMEVAHASPRLGDAKRNYSDTSKARRMLGWQCKTCVEEGIEKTIEYFIATR